MFFIIYIYRFFFFFFFKQKTAYEMLRSLVGSEMCIRDRREALALKRQAAERKQAKQDAAAHRQQVLQRISLDKEERRREQQAAAPQPHERSEERQGEERAARATSGAPRMATIKFRMGDGSMLGPHVFGPEATLADVRGWVEPQIVGSGFHFMNSFPRRLLGAGDMDRTLTELELTPNAMLEVVLGAPAQHRALDGQSSADARQPTSTATKCYERVLLMLNGVWEYFGQTAASPPAPAPAEPARPSAPQVASRGPRNRSTGASRRVVKGLHNLDDQDQDPEKHTATFNGDSTNLI
eukprot:TRINITY_DN20419_c0_g1_i2.p1 TRINITY_DN20419_c0_g1~~TRINITY_DN20419_c0_g1_i2.p1  ORF type:complete len:296 (-),score=88.00 TRINITY_DN20419_c0_g1_i2:211-1098(-)